MHVNHRNRINQTWVTVPTSDATTADAPAVRRVTPTRATVKLSAAASRAIAVMFPAADRDAAVTAATAIATADDRAIRGMVWDVHVFAVAHPDACDPARPWAMPDADAVGFRRAAGLPAAAVCSPRARG